MIHIRDYNIYTNLQVFNEGNMQLCYNTIMILVSRLVNVEFMALHFVAGWFNFSPSSIYVHIISTWLELANVCVAGYSDVGIW